MHYFKRSGSKIHSKLLDLYFQDKHDIIRELLKGGGGGGGGGLNVSNFEWNTTKIEHLCYESVETYYYLFIYIVLRTHTES